MTETAIKAGVESTMDVGRQPTAVFNAWNTARAYFCALAVLTVLPPSAATR